MIIRDQHIALIAKHRQVEQPGYVSICFHRPANFVFQAGDWVDIQFEGRQLSGGITYSISSAPTESDIQITFREGVSQMKQALQAIQPNDRLFISQYGNDYGFQLHQHRSSVLIAGGVGIAPFRSMLKEMSDTHATNSVTLIYLNQNDNFLFKDELEQWAEQLPNLSITYIPTKEINRKKREKLIHSLIKDTAQNFYISGPPTMVESNEHLLIDNGVDVSNIRIDSFGGY